jgi:hypothetical protein
VPGEVDPDSGPGVGPTPEAVGLLALQYHVLAEERAEEGTSGGGAAGEGQREAAEQEDSFHLPSK